ncbi:hypothetical protein D3C78_1873360 [compost metagenome]
MTQAVDQNMAGRTSRIVSEKEVQRSGTELSAPQWQWPQAALVEIGLDEMSR